MHDAVQAGERHSVHRHLSPVHTRPCVVQGHSTTSTIQQFKVAQQHRCMICLHVQVR
jgi:hypothetical protein